MPEFSESIRKSVFVYTRSGWLRRECPLPPDGSPSPWGLKAYLNYGLIVHKMVFGKIPRKAEATNVPRRNNYLSIGFFFLKSSQTIMINRNDIHITDMPGIREMKTQDGSLRCVIEGKLRNGKKFSQDVHYWRTHDNKEIDESLKLEYDFFSKMIESKEPLVLSIIKKRTNKVISQWAIYLEPNNIDLNEDCKKAYQLLLPKWEEWKGYMEYLNCENPENADGPRCYLTTAAVGAVGLDDDCWELQTLRTFRDKVLNLSQEGQRLVKSYYRFAPRLVERLNTYPDVQKIWLRTYIFGIIPAAICAKLKLNILATAIYKKMTFNLLKKARQRKVV